MATRVTRIRTDSIPLLARLLGLCAHWRQRRRERAELRGLTDRDLRDIGISRIDALHEADKPFWRP